MKAKEQREVLVCVHTTFNLITKEKILPNQDVFIFGNTKILTIC